MQRYKKNAGPTKIFQAAEIHPHVHVITRRSQAIKDQSDYQD